MTPLDFRNIRIIYRKELLDIIRDRRTIISMIVIPLVMMPLMMLLVSSIVMKELEKIEASTFTVMVVHPERASGIMDVLRDVDNLEVLDLMDRDQAEILVREGDIEAAVVLPASGLSNEGDVPEIEVLVNESSEHSSTAGRRVRSALLDWREAIAKERIEDLGAPETVIKPFEILRSNVATGEQMTGQFLGMLLPYIMILLTMQGAIYPAIDLTTGEKERSTLETLLASAATRLEIVLGKYFTVMTASLVSATMALISMAFVIGFGFTSFDTPNGQDLGFALSVSPLAISLALAMMIPLAALFSSLLMTIAIFAKSNREAQSYLVPLMMAVIVPAMMSMISTTGVSSNQAWIPVLNVSLVMKEILSGNIDWPLIGTALFSTTLYALAGIFVTMRVFQRESVLFRV